MERFGIHFVHAGDEWYLLAKEELPPKERYDGYIQLENGVGMITLLRDEFAEALEQIEGDGALKRRVTIATGYSAAADLRGVGRAAKGEISGRRCGGRGDPQ